MKHLYATTALLVVLAASGCGSLVGADFDFGPQPVSVADGDAGGGGDRTDSGADVDPVEEPVAPSPDGACADGRKLCDGLCVSKADPRYGCADDCNPCSIPHATAGCRAGACVVRSCESGRANCNANDSDGCEVATATDPSHCGGCGVACSGSEVCAATGCTSTCPSGLEQCGQSCVDVATDPANCGSCGEACPTTANGVATCSSASCGVKCNAGFVACGGTCKAESATSCGASCTVCTAPTNGIALCSAGACDFTCKNGYERSGATCVVAVDHDTWATVASMPTAREGLAAARTSDGRIFAIGGSVGSTRQYTVEAYTPGTNTWATRASMGTARDGLAAVFSDGRIFAIGGYKGPDIIRYSDVLSTAEAYTPGTNTWSAVASMATSRWGLAAASSGGRVYAIGGWSPIDGSPRLATVEAYTPSTNSWAAVASMPTARERLAAVTTADGRVWALGGYNGTFAVGTVEVYTPSTDTWATVKSMPTPRYGLAAAVTADGRIVAIGGNTGSATVGTVEVYTPSTNTWTTASNMPTPRLDLAAVAASDGRIYAMGGRLGTTLFATVEAYTP